MSASDVTAARRVLGLAGPARHFAAIGAALTLLALASHVGGHDDTFRVASAASGPHLQVAPLNSDAFGSRVEGSWFVRDMAPGASIASGLRLRTVGEVAPPSSLMLSASIDGTGSAALLSHLLVSEVTYAGADIRSEWDSCTSGTYLSVAALVTCPGRSLHPLPATGAGSQFTLTVQFDPAAPNSLQGATSGALTLTFTLSGDDPPTPTPTATATATPTATPTPPTAVFTAPPGGPPNQPRETAAPVTISTPVPTATATPSPAGTTITRPSTLDTPTAVARPTPIAPSTGSGRPGPSNALMALAIACFTLSGFSEVVRRLTRRSR